MRRVVSARQQASILIGYINLHLHFSIKMKRRYSEAFTSRSHYNDESSQSRACSPITPSFQASGCRHSSAVPLATSGEPDGVVMSGSEHIQAMQDPVTGLGRAEPITHASAPAVPKPIYLPTQKYLSSLPTIMKYTPLLKLNMSSEMHILAKTQDWGLLLHTHTLLLVPSFIYKSSPYEEYVVYNEVLSRFVVNLPIWNQLNLVPSIVEKDGNLQITLHRDLKLSMEELLKKLPTTAIVSEIHLKFVFEGKWIQHDMCRLIDAAMRTFWVKIQKVSPLLGCPGLMSKCEERRAFIEVMAEALAPTFPGPEEGRVEYIMALLWMKCIKDLTREDEILDSVDSIEKMSKAPVLDLFMDEINDEEVCEMDEWEREFEAATVIPKRNPRPAVNEGATKKKKPVKKEPTEKKPVKEKLEKKRSAKKKAVKKKAVKKEVVDNTEDQEAIFSDMEGPGGNDVFEKLVDESIIEDLL
ncbi:hypothetical protein BZA77DRAFT_373767 [Pyronema omphalodes]|nr:hypothetical protein BZA77DRAFT_373767 [Pyronema omphalodes]